MNARYPDFKQKKTQETLWREDPQNLPWLEEEMAAMASGTVPLDSSSWNKRLTRYVKAGQYKKTLELFQQMQQEGVGPNKFTFVPALNSCASLRALEEGRHIHEQIIQSGCESNVFVGSTLIDMYVKCGSMEDAWRVFKKMPSRNVVSWTAMISGQVKNGQGQKALELFWQMQQEGVKPDSLTFVRVLNACASVVALEEGRLVHQQIIQCGFESNVFVGNSLVDMYAKCGSMKDALRVFDKMPSRDVVSWNALLLGLVKCGQAHKALEFFQRMQREGVKPGPVTFMAILNVCGITKSLNDGRHAHEQIVQSGYDSNVFVGTSLVDMYAKCGSMEDAWRVFNKMPSHDVVSWNAMMFGYVRCREGRKALEIFWQLQQEGVEPSNVTFVGALNACASVVALEEGKCIHELIIQNGCESDVFVGNSLMDMYVKCGSMEDAWRVFNKMPSCNVVSWNIMLGGYAMQGHGIEALALFEQMCEEGVEISNITFVYLLSACSHAGLVDEGLCYFESMSMVYKIPATVEHYTCMVDLLGHASYLHEAEDMVKTVPCKADVAVLRALLGDCRLQPNLEIGEWVAK